MMKFSRPLLFTAGAAALSLMMISAPAHAATADLYLGTSLIHPDKLGGVGHGDGISITVFPNATGYSVLSSQAAGETFGGGGSDSFDYDYTFSLGNTTTSVKASGIWENLLSIGASLVKDTVVANTLVVGTTSISPVPSASPPTPFLSTQPVDQSLVFAGLTPGGIYTLELSGLAEAGLLSSFTGDVVALSPVPLPAALPLFGAALMGLGGLGLRKRKAAQTA
jgi:hypothetical protein